MRLAEFIKKLDLSSEDQDQEQGAVSREQAAGSRQAGREQAGRQGAGSREQAGRQGAGSREQAGRQGAGSRERDRLYSNRSILLACSLLDAAERTGYALQQCRDDAELREVRRLIESDFREHFRCASYNTTIVVKLR